MAIRYAVATGNWSNTATWNGGTLPTSADDVYANGFTVTINQNIAVVSLQNTATTGVNAGGAFPVNGSYTIVADTLTGGSQLLSGSSENINLTITANTISGFIRTNNGTGTNYTINGNIQTSVMSFQLTNINTFTVNGNVVANGVGQNGAIFLISAGTVVINGFCQGGVSQFGFQSGSTSGSYFATVTKAITVNNNIAGVSNASPSFSCTVKEIEQGVLGAVPITGFVRLSTASGAFYKGVTTGSGTRTLSDPADIAGQVPAQSDVRFGVTYQSGSKTGTAYIPAASSVGFGVPVDNTTGTAALTPASVWDAATSSLTTSGSIGERLKNASTVDTTGDQLAALL
jgi:hypothetical protein